MKKIVLALTLLASADSLFAQEKSATGETKEVKSFIEKTNTAQPNSIIVSYPEKTNTSNQQNEQENKSENSPAQNSKQIIPAIRNEDKQPE